MATTKRRVPLKPVRDAWTEYLAHVRSLTGERYDDVEPWAWGRLKEKLEAAGVKLGDGSE